MEKLSSIKLISVAKSKSVYIYKVIEGKRELFNIYSSSIELAQIMNLNKSTIGRYIQAKKIIQWESNKFILFRSPIKI